MKSVEEKVEEYYKKILDDLGIRHYGKTGTVNGAIKKALESAESKSGGNGSNFPDIQFYLEDNYERGIPVMVEAKGSKNALVKFTKDGDIEGITTYESDSREGAKNPHKAGDPNYTTIQKYAVNGAKHYGDAIFDGTDYKEVLIIGVNGTKLDSDETLADPECRAYYISKRNNKVPKFVSEITATDWSVMKHENLDHLFDIFDHLILTDEEIEALKKKTENTLEEKVKAIHQSLYENECLKSALSTNDKLYLFCGLIMAGLKTEGIVPLNPEQLLGNNNEHNNDGTLILQYVDSFLSAKNCSEDKVEMVKGLLKGVLTNKVLWKPHNGESILKTLFAQVKNDIIPCLEGNLHLDFTGRILNSLNDWVSIDNDAKNDVVLTPSYVTKMMAIMARTNMNSFCWDGCMGSGTFLVSEMDLMIKDAQDKLHDRKTLENKIRNIKENQLLGVEILGNIYMLAVLNMILMGDGSSRIMKGNSHEFDIGNFPANVYTINPPYSAEGKGFVFAEEAFSKMQNGWGCILIQDSAGNGQGLPYTKRILEHSTLRASIKMPSGLFGNKASVSVYIFVFEIGRPHQERDIVKFIDFSEDGYSRQNRKKSTQEVNLRNTDHAEERYREVEDIVLDQMPETSYYTESNGKIVKDTVTTKAALIKPQKKVDDIKSELAPYKKQLEDIEKKIEEIKGRSAEDTEKRKALLDSENPVLEKMLPIEEKLRVAQNEYNAIESKIGADWLFTQHQKTDTRPTEEDFKKTVADYLTWKVSELMKGHQ